MLIPKFELQTIEQLNIAALEEHDFRNKMKRRKNFPDMADQAGRTTYFHALDTLKVISDVRMKLLTASMFAYAWMPTMLNTGLRNQNILAYLEIETADFSIPMQTLVNNSWAGTSKALHFIAPERFAIWDSRVAKNFWWKKDKKKCPVNHRGAYLAYLEWIKEYAKNPLLDDVVKSVRNNQGEEISRIRAIELLLYYRNGQAQTNSGNVSAAVA